jgi:hypothetical protein
MISLQNAKYAVLIKQQAATNAATLTSDNLDCLGADQVTLIVHGTTSDNATNNPSVLKVQESATTDATNFSDVAALVGDGAGGFTIPSSPTATTTAPFAVLNVNLRKGPRKRYLRVLISPVTTQTFSVLAVFPESRLEQVPDSITEQNVAVVANA